jgi:NADH:flavin oxidoreductase / NADH oxidase family
MFYECDEAVPRHAGWGEVHQLFRVGSVPLVGSPDFLQRQCAATPAYHHQVPYAERIRRESGVRTLAVGLIVHAQQAENILQSERVDVIAVGRELLYNPNWALDTAQKLGCDPGFALVPPSQYWLQRRAAAVPAITPSTFGALDIPRN